MKIKIITWISPLVFTTIITQNSQAKKLKLETDIDKVSYSIGQQIAKSISSQKVKLNNNILVDSLKSALNNEPNQLNQTQTMSAMKSYSDMNKKQMAKVAQKNKLTGDNYLNENKKQKGILTTKSGLQYKVIKKGHGNSPNRSSMVKVHYEGTLINGEEFDSSYKRKQPAVFAVNGVIPGWTEALQMMKPGAEWELFIPSDLAYGTRGSGDKIPPNSVLKFKVELLEIVKEQTKEKTKG
jgi:FKBP-type peptidyl-prolyl cis-trans isomerase